MISKRRNVQDELEQLRAIVESQRSRLESLEAGSDADGESHVQSRRQMLKLAGAALVGAAGGAALSPLAAEAANGGNMVIGQTNQETAGTLLQVTSGNPGLVMQFDATFGGTGNNDGIDAYATGSGAAVFGSAASGPGGLFESSSGPDVQLGSISKFTLGTGRFAQILRSDVGSSFSAGYAAASGFGEIVRGSDGSIWASRTTGTTNAAWKRLTAIRVDSAANDGSAFVPARLVDTRNGTGGFTGPLSPGASHTWTIAGSGGVPTDAVGVVGNLTAAGWNASLGGGGGFLVIYPAGTSTPGASTVNYQGNVAAWANAFTVALGTGANAGKVTVFNSNNTTCHVILDVTGYLV